MKTPIEDPNFLSEAFSAVLKKKSYKNEIRKLLLDEDASHYQLFEMTPIQEASSVRNVQLTRELAKLLIDDEGELDVKRLDMAIKTLGCTLYSLGPDRQHEGVRREHILQVLKSLKNTKSALLAALKKIDKPHAHPYAEEIIRHTLDLEPQQKVTDIDARRAALAAWMCYLRQNVGSCFATAPAIIVHGENPETFFADLMEILATGRLKRTFGGVEHAVPISASWGAGDLKRQFLYLREEGAPLWEHPGIVAAFQAAELNQVEGRIKRLLVENEDLPPVLVLSVDALLNLLLMEEIAITEQDLKDYGERPRDLRPTALMVAMPDTKQKGKFRKCEEFYARKSFAEDAFKRLADNALLKCWEFTLASFAETKAQFAKWNLYSSLGLSPNDKGGIGPCLFEILQRKVNECNARVEKLQEEYEALFAQVKFLERRLKRADSEQQARWMRGDYQSKVNEFHTIEEIRNRTNEKARRFAHLFDGLINLYIDLFPKYFQEVYDADMQDITAGPYDDSPAGFRLVYKHGRVSTASWTSIEDRNQFVESLISFFVATESEISGTDAFRGIEEDVSEIVTAVVTHVKTDEFLESALFRMAKIHKEPIVKDPLNNLDKVKKKPWVYTSGGTMGTLVSNYFCRDESPKEESRWVERPIELLVYLIDLAKQGANQNLGEQTYLIHSPTHAFLFKPSLFPFCEAVKKKKEYTYTWVRDNLVNPAKTFVRQTLLDREEINTLVDILSKKIPKSLQKYFKKVFGEKYGRLSPMDFRDKLIDGLKKDRNFQFGDFALISAEDVDHLLYTHLPLFPRHQLQKRVRTICEELPNVDVQAIQSLMEKLSTMRLAPPLITAKQLQEICQGLLLLHLGTPWTKDNYPQLITTACQKLGFAMPTPILFADTNWMKDWFGFAVNPGTGSLDLFRLDTIGREGTPMLAWHHWLDGSHQEPKWGVYTNPADYSP